VKERRSCHSDPVGANDDTGTESWKESSREAKKGHSSAAPLSKKTGNCVRFQRAPAGRALLATAAAALDGVVAPLAPCLVSG
jgi:hypothetical protein